MVKIDPSWKIRWQQFSIKIKKAFDRKKRLQMEVAIGENKQGQTSADEISSSQIPYEKKESRCALCKEWKSELELEKCDECERNVCVNCWEVHPHKSQ